MRQIPPMTLRESGERAAFVADAYQPGALILEIDGTPQSHVYPDSPGELFFEYVRRIGHVIDVIRPPGEPITALHLGAGALTLPRYIAATRPDSRQQVLERHADLIDYVRTYLPLPPQSAIRFRYGDARETLSRLPSGLTGAADIVVVDIFSGSRIPAHVTSVEFFTHVAKFLRPDGVVVANIADGPGLAFARSQAATLAHVFPHVTAIAEAQVLKGRRFGNVVIIGSPRAQPFEWLPRLLAGGPHPAQAVSGETLRAFIGSAPLVTDATAIPSPTPQKNIFARKAT